MSVITTPKAKKEEKILELHGHKRIDNYFWMNQRDHEDVIDYLNQENNYTTAQLKDTEQLQKDLFEEMKGRIKEDDSTVPYFKEGWWHYSRYEKGQEYAFICRKKDSLDNSEEVILNVNELAKDHAFYQLGGLSLSTNQKLLAYSEDTVSRRQYNIRIKNLETGENLEDYIENTTGGITWANDNKTIFYVKKDPQTLRSYRIYRHELGTSTENDVLVYEETDETFNTYIHKSKSKKYLIISSQATLTSESQILEADNPTGTFRYFQKRVRGVEYGISHHNGRFLIRTNYEALNFRLMESSEENTSIEDWKEVIPNRSDVLFEDFVVFDKHLVLEERKLGLIQLRIINTELNTEHYLKFDDEAYSAYIGTNPTFDSDTLRFGYNSMSTPPSVFDYNMNDKTKVLKKQQEVLDDNFAPENYKVHRIMVPARDGVKVPLSIVHHKDTKLNGSAPCLEYGYGSYGINIDPGFSSIRLSLLDRGFVYAIAHIRGSETLGRQWYEDGKLLKKLNTFHDFIDCGKYLVENGFAAKDKLYAMGGSAGGMLMGGIINMEPELYTGVIASVPFVDCVSTMLDDSIPLTTGEYDEWGNPNEKEYYDYMLKYSPYDNIEAKAYPNLFVLTGYHDSQVQYWEPAKWVAKLRELKTDSNLLIFRTNMETGHSGASGRFEPLKEVAMEYAFLMKLAGKSKY